MRHDLSIGVAAVGMVLLVIAGCTATVDPSAGSRVSQENSEDPEGDLTAAASAITPNADYSVIAKHSGKCLDVTGWNTADLTGIIQFSCHGGDNQKFLFR